MRITQFIKDSHFTAAIERVKDNKIKKILKDYDLNKIVYTIDFTENDFTTGTLKDNAKYLKKKYNLNAIFDKSKTSFYLKGSLYNMINWFLNEYNPYSTASQFAKELLTFKSYLKENRE